MLGYAAFALCGPKYVRDICPNKAKPALGALHTVSRRGRGKLLAGFVSLQSQCCDATVRRAGTLVFMCCKLQCVCSLLCFCPEKSGTCLREKTMKPERPERDTEQRLNWIWPGYSLWYWKAQVGRNGASQRGVNTLGSRQTCLHCAKQKCGLILGFVVEFKII